MRLTKRLGPSEPIRIPAPEPRPSSRDDADAAPGSTSALSWNLTSKRCPVNPSRRLGRDGDRGVATDNSEGRLRLGADG